MIIAALVLSLCINSATSAQPTWVPATPVSGDIVEPFGATMIANLPTSTMLYSGDWHYEVSHRFLPSVGTQGAFLGLDGGANVRMSVGYGVTDDMSVRIGRSSLHDNVDAHFKFRFWSNSIALANSVAGLRLGIARNGDLPGDHQGARLWQYYAQLIYNVQWSDVPLSIGIVPSYLHNTAPFSVRVQSSLVVGFYALYAFRDSWGLWLETAPVFSGYRGRLWPLERADQRYRSPVSAGLSWETGGHVFYLFMTNSLQLNASQFLAGTPTEMSKGNWHLGFAITRHL